MKKILLFLMAVMCLTLTSCKEHFSDGERVGTVTKLVKLESFGFPGTVYLTLLKLV